MHNQLSMRYFMPKPMTGSVGENNYATIKEEKKIKGN